MKQQYSEIVSGLWELLQTVCGDGILRIYFNQTRDDHGEASQDCLGEYLSEATASWLRFLRCCELNSCEDQVRPVCLG